MKGIKRIIAIVALLFSVSAYNHKAQALPLQVSVSFQFFYDELTPHGSWISYPSHGYVWVPRVAGGFRPYMTHGHWVFTEHGWMWASFYDWGWAPFHYGRWMMDPLYGWVWVPGYDWAPAWVVWGSYGGYYGWAPLAPGFSISLTSYHPPLDYWAFMHPSYITATNYSSHVFISHNRRISLGSNAAITDVQRISPVNNTGTFNSTSFNAGPRRTEIEQAGNVRVKETAIRETREPSKASSGSGSVAVYRPKIEKSAARDARPKTVTPADDVKQRSIRTREDEARPEKSQDIRRTRDNEARPEKSRETKPAGSERTSPQQDIRRPAEEKQRSPEPRMAPDRRESAPQEKAQPKRMEEPPSATPQRQPSAPQQDRRQPRQVEPRIKRELPPDQRQIERMPAPGQGRPLEARPQNEGRGKKK